MHKTIRPVLAAVGLALICASPVLAADPVRLRGTIQSVDGNKYVIKNRDGVDVKLTVTNEKPLYIGLYNSQLSDVKAGQFIGATALPQADGSQKVSEIHIFPESMRGLGEGHYPWDLYAGGTMTNANIEQSVAATDGNVLTVKYKDGDKTGEKKLILGPKTIVVTFYPGELSEIKPGVKIWAGPDLKLQDDGSLLSPLLIYGKDGAEPPF
jgi:hypothetical protein